MKLKATMIILIAILCAASVFSACAPAAGGNDTAAGIAPGSDTPVGTTGGTTGGTTDGGSEVPGGSGVLVVYFPCTGNTKKAAEKIAALTGGDIYEIVPAEPYSAADLNYNNDCRANREMNDPTARPAIGGGKADISGYDTVIIGYPIWWGTMPRIINTFIESCELSGKTVLPFCTSGSSGISRSVSDIKTAAPTADVRDGLRTSGVSDAELEKWLRAGGAIK